MAAKPQICVIGLGKFGYKVGTSLIHLNHQVIGIDANPIYVQRAQKIFNQVYEADISNKQALQQIGFREITHALISVGDSISTSAMTTMYLKEMQVPNVWVKAINEDHATLLRKIGADEVIIPEHIAAAQFADRIHIPGIIERLPFDPDMIIRELTIDKLARKSLREIDLTNRFNCQIIAVRSRQDTHYRYIPKADDILSAGDNIIVIGKSDSLAKIIT
ncbi:MAG: TrkA family potassium uptake protein [Desulfobacteraceae bacterium]|nr:TrkA family potassium uptake protein [Desulfobacteraceae bacterium]MBC2749092.1 TrkA family potassium uptake protein [Desulfobacteraceae bacterium]